MHIDTGADEDAEPHGLDGHPPSPRPLWRLILADADMLVFGILGLAAFAWLAASAVHAVPGALALVAIVTLVACALFVRARIRRAQRLARAGLEVEGRLVDVRSSRYGHTARYRYDFLGYPRIASHTSVLFKDRALRHGDRVVVLVHPRRPDDPVILGSYPTS